MAQKQQPKLELDDILSRPEVRELIGKSHATLIRMQDADLPGYGLGERPDHTGDDTQPVAYVYTRRQIEAWLAGVRPSEMTAAEEEQILTTEDVLALAPGWTLELFYYHAAAHGLMHKTISLRVFLRDDVTKFLEAAYIGKQTVTDGRIAGVSVSDWLEARGLSDNAFAQAYHQQFGVSATYVRRWLSPLRKGDPITLRTDVYNQLAAIFTEKQDGNETA
jgi:hypothetical protein